MGANPISSRSMPATQHALFFIELGGPASGPLGHLIARLIGVLRLWAATQVLGGSIFHL